MINWSKPIVVESRAAHDGHSRFGTRDGRPSMPKWGFFDLKARISLALAVLVVGVAAVASTAIGGTTGKAANTLTVWLMTDAQQNPSWEKIVNAASAAFEKDHAGWNVTCNTRPGETTCSSSTPRSPAGTPGRPRAGEHGDDEVHGRRRVPGPHLGEVVDPELEHLACGPRGVGEIRRQGVRRPLLRRARVVTYRTDLFKQAGIKKPPTSLAEFTAAAKKLNAKVKTKGFSPVYIAGTDWYTALGFVYDYGGKIATQTSGKWKGTLDSPRAIAGLTAYKNFFAAASHASKTTDEAIPTRTTCTPRVSSERCPEPAGSRAVLASTRASRPRS